MLIDVLLVAAGTLALVVAALSERLRHLPVSEPVLGLAVGVLLGPELLGLLTVPPLTEDSACLHIATRLLLAVSVMAVAPRYPAGRVRSAGARSCCCWRSSCRSWPWCPPGWPP